MGTELCSAFHQFMFHWPLLLPLLLCECLSTSRDFRCEHTRYTECSWVTGSLASVSDKSP